ncbi:MAG: hypothetical protein JSV33_09775 [bacterium]|nr:MAG: hypothetical protein JSV33_09775 [bacterium]
MPKRRTIGFIAVVLVGVGLWSNTARAEGEKADTTKIDRFKPTWKSFMVGKDTYVGLGSSMSISIKPGGGWQLSHSVSVETRDYRGRDMKEITERLTNAASKVVPGLYSVNLGFGENYMKKKTLGLARFGKDIVVNNEFANANFTLEKPLLGAASSEIVVKADGRRGLNDYKYDSAISGSVSGSFRYGFGDNFNIRGGVGTSRRRESSEIGSRQFGGMPSKADTVRLFVDYGEGEKAKKPLTVEYTRSFGIDRKVSPPRGNALEILDNPDKALQEEQRKITELIMMGSYLRPVPWLQLEFQFKHELSDQKNKVDTRLSTKRVSTDIKGSATYYYASSGRLRFDVTNYEGEFDYGPQSPSSFEENKKSFGVTVRQEVWDSIKVYLRGTTSLKQQFFKQRRTNPRDADFLYYGGIFRLEAVPFKKVSTMVSANADRYERINIDRSLSGENRVDYTYEVKPGFTIRPLNWVSISQEYRIKIEFTDFVHTEERNFLNRTTTLDTKANLTIRKPLTFGFNYRYLMKDTGSYLSPDGGERWYNRQSEDFENGLFLSLIYQPEQEFTIKAEADFRNQKNNRLGTVDGQKAVTGTTLYESGSLRVGVARKKEISWNGLLDLDIAYVKRFGPFLSKERKEYWEVDTSLTFKF